MDPLALGLILLAAVLHATWNILLKTAADPLRYATIGVVAASLVLTPAVVVGWLAFDRPDVPPAAWALGIVSGAAETAYFVFLAAAYRRGDISIVYPLARGIAPVLAVAFGVGVLGERLPPAAALGVGLLVAGLLVVQRPWRLVRASLAGDRAAAGFALLTGLTIATYSALDRVGVRLAPTWVYAGILWLACAAGLVLVSVLRDRLPATRRAADGTPTPVRLAVTGGFITFAAYALVLAALSRAPLAIIGPLRECSVILISGWGILRLREAVGRREVSYRLAGAGLVLVGAVALAIGR